MIFNMLRRFGTVKYVEDDRMIVAQRRIDGTIREYEYPLDAARYCYRGLRSLTHKFKIGYTVAFSLCPYPINHIISSGALTADMISINGIVIEMNDYDKYGVIECQQYGRIMLPCSDDDRIEPPQSRYSSSLDIGQSVCLWIFEQPHEYGCYYAGFSVEYANYMGDIDDPYVICEFLDGDDIGCALIHSSVRGFSILRDYEMRDWMRIGTWIQRRIRSDDHTLILDIGEMLDVIDNDYMLCIEVYAIIGNTSTVESFCYAWNDFIGRIEVNKELCRDYQPLDVVKMHVYFDRSHSTPWIAREVWTTDKDMELQLRRNNSQYLKTDTYKVEQLSMQNGGILVNQSEEVRFNTRDVQHIEYLPRRRTTHVRVTSYPQLISTNIYEYHALLVTSIDHPKINRKHRNINMYGNLRNPRSIPKQDKTKVDDGEKTGVIFKCPSDKLKPIQVYSATHGYFSIPGERKENWMKIGQWVTVTTKRVNGSERMVEEYEDKGELFPVEVYNNHLYLDVPIVINKRMLTGNATGWNDMTGIVRVPEDINETIQPFDVMIMKIGFNQEVDIPWFGVSCRLIDDNDGHIRMTMTTRLRYSKDWIIISPSSDDSYGLLMNSRDEIAMYSIDNCIVTDMRPGQYVNAVVCEQMGDTRYKYRAFLVVQQNRSTNVQTASSVN